ncbi:MAG: hypothetical protein IPG23_17555 [Burkholderiales bacterium]|nr:hypothetical protein [Burkholderiales bacterium]
MDQPRTLTSEWQDYTGTTPVATPGTVADSANPVGLALDIRAGAPEVLGPELVVNGGPFVGAGLDHLTSVLFPVADRLPTVAGANAQAYQGLTYAANMPYEVTITIDSLVGELNVFSASSLNAMSFTTAGVKQFNTLAATVDYPYITARFLTGASGVISSISVKEVPGNHMLQSTSTSRPLASARVNFLQYTQDFSNAWGKTDLTVQANRSCT